MDKEDVVYLQWNITEPLKRNELLPSATTWMDLEDIMLSEISQTEKDKYCTFSLICGIENKTKQKIKYNKTETDSQIQRTD